MKANEFVKKVGWDLAKELADECPDYCNYLHENGFYIISETWQLNERHVLVLDLKRIIKSYDLVEKYKKGRGIRFRIRWGQFRHGDTKEYNDRLKQAIADVESCMEVSSESN